MRSRPLLRARLPAHGNSFRLEAATNSRTGEMIPDDPGSVKGILTDFFTDIRPTYRAELSRIPSRSGHDSDMALASCSRIGIRPSDRSLASCRSS